MAEPAPRAAEPRTVSRVGAIIAASAVVIIAVIVAFSVGRLSTLADPTPNDTSAEAGFARDMQEHHLQGVEMAMIIRDASDDPDIRLLGYDIATTQAGQAGQMYGWLVSWGLSQRGSEPSMTWMTRGPGGDHHTTDAAGGHRPGDPMPGLATPGQMAELRAAEGREAEVLFLELMIAHHAGAVEMADAVLERSANRPVVLLANSIVASQQAEIDLMQRLLDERR